MKPLTSPNVTRGSPARDTAPPARRFARASLVRFAEWLAPPLGAAAAGVFLVRFLTAHPLEMSQQLLLTCLAVAVTLVALAMWFRGVRLLIAMGLALLGLCGGYVAQTALVLNAPESWPVPPITRARGDPGDGHTAVIYLTHGEPRTYDPSGWIAAFHEFDERQTPFVPWLARPLFLAQARSSYLEVGASEHSQIHQRMAAQVEAALRADGYAGLVVYPAFLDDNPRPDAAAIQALNAGASHIVVAEVFVSRSDHTEQGEARVRSVPLADYGVSLRFTETLWDSATLHKMFVARLNEAVKEADRAKVGVLLVGHGQPASWDALYPTETVHELAFREAILEELVAAGYPREHVGLAWMEYREPRADEQLTALLTTGVKEVYYFSAAISADGIHSQHDVPQELAAVAPPGIRLVNLGGWNDHPLTIQAITEQVEGALR